MRRKLAMILVLCVLCTVAFSGCNKKVVSKVATVTTSTTSTATTQETTMTTSSATTTTKKQTTTTKHTTKTTAPTTTSILSKYKITEYQVNMNNSASSDISYAIAYGFSYQTIVDMINGKKTKIELQNIRNKYIDDAKNNVGGMSKEITPLTDGFLSKVEAEEIARKTIFDLYSFQVSNNSNNKRAVFYDNTTTQTFRDGMPDFTWEFYWFLSDDHLQMYRCTLDAKTGKLYMVYKKSKSELEDKISTKLKNKLINETLKNGSVSQFAGKSDIEGIVLTWSNDIHGLNITVNVYYKNKFKISLNNSYNVINHSTIKTCPIVND